MNSVVTRWDRFAANGRPLNDPPERRGTGLVDGKAASQVAGADPQNDNQ